MFTQPFIRAQIKENIKAPRHWPLCGEFTGDRLIPRTNGQLRRKCFHLMTSSWVLKFIAWYLWHESVWLNWVPSPNQLQALLQVFVWGYVIACVSYVSIKCVISINKRGAPSRLPAVFHGVEHILIANTLRNREAPNSTWHTKYGKFVSSNPVLVYKPPISFP